MILVVILLVVHHCRMEPLCTGEVQSEDDQAFEVEPEQDPPHWQTLVSTEVLALLSPHEIKRQEVINGEESHEGPRETLGGGLPSTSSHNHSSYSCVRFLSLSLSMSL